MRLLAHTNFNFIKWRWHAVAFSLAVTLAGVGTILARGGLPLGVDFAGGTVVVAEFAKPTSEDAVRTALGALSRDAVVQKYGETTRNDVMIRLPMAPGVEQGTSLNAEALKIEEALRGSSIGEFKIVSKDIVGPTAGADLKSKGIWATFTALGGLLVYIALRFRFTFAVGAVIATFHDILVTLAFLTWFGYDLSLNVIAAILTIAGYSVNDTIVVFDRVRENQRTMRREPLDQVVNTSVNQTLGRTIITSGTTFLAVVSLYIFGGEVLRGFAFTMIVGIVTGTYSTVFVAASIAIILSRRPTSQVQQTASQAQQARAKRRA